MTVNGELGAAPAGSVTRWIAVAVLLAIAALNVVVMFQPYNMSAHTGQHQYDAMSGMPDLVPFIVAPLLCALLLLRAGTRAFAVGFGLGFTALWFATDYMTLEWPKGNAQFSTTAQWCIYGSRALALPVVICLLILGLRRGAGAEDGSGVLTWWRPRVWLLLAGLVAAVAWAVANSIDVIRATPGSLDTAHTPVSCCDFSQGTGDAKIDIVSGVVIVLILVVLAAVVRSTAASSGILTGVLAAVAGSLGLLVTMVSFPVEFQLGLQNPYLASDPSASRFPSYAALAGFWCAAGFALLVALLAVSGPLIHRSRTPEIEV